MGLHHRHMLPVCTILGMLLVVVADYIGKTVVSPAEVPVGIVIAIIGVPYFVTLLMKRPA
ncbi:Iron-uptake system permease protein FeuC [compost metagenome]